MIISGRERLLIVPGSIRTSQNELKRAEKNKEAFLEGLKCLIKESVVALPIELQLLYSCFYRKHLAKISQKSF